MFGSDEDRASKDDLDTDMVVSSATGFFFAAERRSLRLPFGVMLASCSIVQLRQNIKIHPKLTSGPSLPKGAITSWISERGS